MMFFNSPISSTKANELIEILGLNSESRVLDVGCGTGEFLIRVIEKFNAKGDGVDINSNSINEAQNIASSRIPDYGINFHKIDIKKFDKAPASFDCGICLGSTHAFSMNDPAYPETLKGLSKLVKPGGQILIGESFWMKEPLSEYLDFIGEPTGTYRTHLENVELGMEHGLVPQYVVTSNLDEWDDFEWRHNIKKEQEYESGPKEALDREKIEFSRKWRMAYLKWGRGTMGFAFYLFKKPLN